MKDLDRRPPPVVLLGTHCLTGLQASRILWRKGVPVIGVSDKVKRAYCRTRSVKRTIATPEIWDNPIPPLQEIAAQYEARPVLIPCTDEFVWWLNERRKAIGEVADFLLPPHDVLELLSDKARFYRYATEHNLPLPETRIVATLKELELASREMSFPTVLKPPRKSPEWMEVSNNLKVLKVETAEELLQIGKVLLETSHLILQDWVRGPETNSRELCVCFDKQSRPLASLFLKKIRQWPPAVGVSSLAVEVPPDETVSTGLDMLQNLGYAGAGQLEFKKDEESGKLYIIEMNAGRVALNFPLCEACGMEMTYTCYCAAAGLPLPEARTITRPGSKWICWKTDLASVYALRRRGDLTVRDWLRSVRGHKWSADIQLDDLFPLSLDLIQKSATLLGRTIRKIMIQRAPRKTIQQ